MDKEKDKEKEKKLHEAILLLFLLMLKYSNKINPLLNLFKSNRDLVKTEINKIYLKYTKMGKLEMTNKDITNELKKLEPIFQQIGKDLVIKEKDILIPLLYTVYRESYYRTYYELSKGIELEVKKLSDSIISQSINKKIQDKTILTRNKDNKTKFISKVNGDLKQQLKKGSSIELINKTIDKNFNIGAYYSQRLIENQVAIKFNEAQRKAYVDADVKKVLFSAILDDRTTELCESLNGNIYNLDEAPEPPLHLYCRSTLLPIYPNWSKKENSETYETFMKRNGI